MDIPGPTAIDGQRLWGLAPFPNSPVLDAELPKLRTFRFHSPKADFASRLRETSLRRHHPDRVTHLSSFGRLRKLPCADEVMISTVCTRSDWCGSILLIFCALPRHSGARESENPEPRGDQCSVGPWVPGSMLAHCPGMTRGFDIAGEGVFSLIPPLLHRGAWGISAALAAGAREERPRGRCCYVRAGAMRQGRKGGGAV
jgi:hypothetical protein